MVLPFDLREAPKWTRRRGPDRDVVVSSRLRLARNVSGIPFPVKATEETKRSLLRTAEVIVDKLSPDETFYFLGVDELAPLERAVIPERRLGSTELTEDPQGGLVFGASESKGFLINEEDHFRIQSLRPGYDLEAAHGVAERLESDLREQFNFAYDEKWGYLTACPSNLGTGLRASVLLHLPGLILRDEISRVLKAIANLGLTVRGYYGEGTESQGFYLQLSNQVTLGRSVESLLDSLARVTERLIKKERKARNSLLEKSSQEVEDQIWRAYGTAQNARKIDGSESLQYLSLCRLGSDLGLLDEVSVVELDRLTMKIQSEHLNLSVGEKLSSEDRDTYRAQLIRKALEGGLNGEESPEIAETDPSEE